MPKTDPADNTTKPTPIEIWARGKIAPLSGYKSVNELSRLWNVLRADVRHQIALAPHNAKDAHVLIETYAVIDEIGRAMLTTNANSTEEVAEKSDVATICLAGGGAPSEKDLTLLRFNRRRFDQVPWHD